MTHEHTDHINGIKMLVKYHDTKIMAPEGVARALGAVLPEVQSALRCFKAGTSFTLGDLSVQSFITMHDTPESVGYRFEDGRTAFVLATDIGCVTQTVMDAALGSDLAVIEANHDVTMVKNGAYPYFLKRRILSDHGHLSNDDCGRFATALLNAGTRKILLAHLSRENNTPRLAWDTVGGALGRTGADVGKDVVLQTAPADALSDVYIL